MKIGYGKLGRSMPLDRSHWGIVGGDDEPPLLLKTLAERYPEHEFIIVGMNSGEEPKDVGLPPNVTNPWTYLRQEIPKIHKSSTKLDMVKLYDEIVTIPLFNDLDHVIVWAGQSGTSNAPIPMIGYSWDDPLEYFTDPQESFLKYASYMVRGINLFRDNGNSPLDREEIWLNADPRNHPKARDLKWPQRLPILTQYDFTRKQKFERYDDTRSPYDLGFDNVIQSWDHIWEAYQYHTYSRLEICGILREHIDSHFESNNFNDRRRFGLFINEARRYVTHNRRDIMSDWVMPLNPDFIHGKWGDGHENDLGQRIDPAPHDDYYPLIRSVKSTFTTPSSGSAWATTKPWQAFAVGTVCFFHPLYDDQDHILKDVDPHLREWLRVSSPEELKTRIDHLDKNESDWLWLITEQRKLYDYACDELHHVKMIENRMGVGL